MYGTSTQLNGTAAVAVARVRYVGAATNDHMAKLAKFFEERYPGLMEELVAWH